MSEIAKVSKRRVDLDLMRIIACFLVIYNHTEGYHLFMNTDTALKAWIYMFPAMITRINVPLFFMISGALLLSDRKETYSQIIKKRVSRIVILLLIFIAVLYFFTLGKTFEGFSFEEYIRSFFAGPSGFGGGAYWYLYCYLGFLLLLPILRKITKTMTKQDFVVLVVIHFVFSSLLPIINIILSANNIRGISISGDFSGALNLAIAKVMFYPLIGYFLDHNISIEKIGAKQIWLLILLALGGIVASNVCTFYEGTHGEMKYTQNYVQLFDYLSTISVFILVKYFCFKHNSFFGHPHVSFMVTTIGSLTLGIYLLDPVLKKWFYQDFYAKLQEAHMIKILISVLWCFTSMLVGGMITYFLKKIPGFRKLL